MNQTLIIMQEEENLEDDCQVHSPSPSSCCFGGCFGLFGIRPCTSRNNHDHEHKLLLLNQESGRHEEEITWWRKNLNKAKECSEVLGGPKWEKFIRKVGGYCKNMKEKHKNRFSKKQKQKNTRFQYDLQSYALNFDSEEGREGDDGVPDFAARFSAPLSKEHGSIGRPVLKTGVSVSAES